MTKTYAYNIGDTVNGLLITEKGYILEGKTHKKAYKYTCTVCGYDCGEYYKNGEYHKEHMIRESNLKHGAGCAICSRNGFVSPKINSLYAICPDIERFLIDRNDLYKYSPSSTNQIKCKCPDCGKEYIRSVYKLRQYGICCNCGDGFSYPEKFIHNMLDQLNIKFDPQFYISKDSLLRYDFYLEEYKIILEVNGIQHYKEKWHTRDEFENDKKKKEFALSKGIKEENYIILDCRESNLEFIKSSVLNSKLNKIFDLSQIDFKKCSEYASSNLAKQASELWNNGNTIKDISMTMQLNKHTIIKYLKQGNDNGWCAYTQGDGMKRRPNLIENLKLKTKLQLSSEEIENKNRRKRIYSSWRNMRRRCYNVKDEKYSRYGERGIKVCNEWNDFESFLNWTLNNGYKDGFVLSRIDINKDYYPENCCWVAKNKLHNNKSTNHFITFNEETHTLQEWSSITGLDRRTIAKRIDKYRWSIEDALTKPVKQQKDKDALLISFNGERHTLSEWSKILNIKRETLKSRLCNGWSVEKAFTYNIKQKNNINK